MAKKLKFKPKPEFSEPQWHDEFSWAVGLQLRCTGTPGTPVSGMKLTKDMVEMLDYHFEKGNWEIQEQNMLYGKLNVLLKIRKDYPELDCESIVSGDGCLIIDSYRGEKMDFHLGRDVLFCHSNELIKEYEL